MPTVYHKSKRKTEDAYEALINVKYGEYLDGIPIFKGLSASDLETPRIELVASRATPELIGDDDIGGYVTGNMFVEVEWKVVSHKSDLDRNVHGNRCAEFEDIAMANDIIDQLNNLGIYDFRAFTWRPGLNEDEIIDDEVVTRYEGILYMAPSTLES